MADGFSGGDRGLAEFVIVGPKPGDRAFVKAMGRWATYDGLDWLVALDGGDVLKLPTGIDPEGVTETFVRNVLGGESLKAARNEFDPDRVYADDGSPATPQPAGLPDPWVAEPEYAAAPQEAVLQEAFPLPPPAAPAPARPLRAADLQPPAPPAPPAPPRLRIDQVATLDQVDFNIWMRSATDAELLAFNEWMTALCRR